MHLHRQSLFMRLFTMPGDCNYSKCNNLPVTMTPCAIPSLLLFVWISDTLQFLNGVTLASSFCDVRSYGEVPQKSHGASSNLCSPTSPHLVASMPIARPKRLHDEVSDEKSLMISQAMYVPVCLTKLKLSQGTELYSKALQNSKLGYFGPTNSCIGSAAHQSIVRFMQ